MPIDQPSKCRLLAVLDQTQRGTTLSLTPLAATMAAKLPPGGTVSR